MFKIIYRTLIFLAAAVLVSFGLIWFSGTSAGQSAFASGGHDQPAMTQTTTNHSTTSAPTFNGEFDRGQDSGGINITHALSNLPGKIGIIAAITVAVVLARKLISLSSRKHGPGTAIPA